MSEALAFNAYLFLKRAAGDVFFFSLLLEMNVLLVQNEDSLTPTFCLVCCILEVLWLVH